jgi:hypothetical protein
MGGFSETTTVSKQRMQGDANPKGFYPDCVCVTLTIFNCKEYTTLKVEPIN